jgi:plasmid maintenance system killer protein
MENYTDTELRIKAKLEDLLSIRREYIKASADKQELKEAGTQAWDELRAELAVGLHPAKRQTKKKARRD